MSVGCTNQTTEKHTETDYSIIHSPSGDLRETTANKKALPSFLKQSDPSVTKAYQIAASYADLLDWIRKYIDEKYQKGYALPTQTPMPS